MKKRIVLAVIGLALSFFVGRYLFIIFNENANKIIFEVIFPAGNLYAPYKETITTHVDDGELEENTSKNAEKETQEETKEPPASMAESEEEQYAMAVMNSEHSIKELMNFNFVKDKFYVVSSVTDLTEEILDLKKVIATDLRIQQNNEGPQILIFHTHGQEKFADSAQNNKSIVDVGAYLTQLLTEKYGYNVLHITDSFDLVDGVLDRSTAYTYANERIEELLEEYPSIEVIIDLHRDGVNENTHLVTEIEGKQTAKIMLFNGISYTNAQGDLEDHYNPYRTENLAMTYQMYLLGEQLYPDFIRCIYVEGYRYCLHHRPRSMLIEAGAQTNTYEEVYNAMEPLARMLALELGYTEK